MNLSLARGFQGAALLTPETYEELKLASKTMARGFVL